ncbi:MAG: DnaA ATPase domain-containing protein, partial [Phycisphaeraceae bacterium]
SRLRHRLEDFVVGSSNQLAYAAANRMAEETGEAGSVLFLHGGCGLGKTHLLQGLCRRMLETNRAAKVHYTTGEQFTNDYIAAVRSGKLEGFRRRMRRLDLLAVDDVHFIANKPATQQEFLHSFDHLELGGARVALASDSHPKLIKQFSEALVSRCVRGLVVQIHPPDLELRQQLVQVLAGRRELVLEEGVAAALASRSGGSVREIEGALTKLQAIARLTRPAGQASAANVGHALVRQLFEHEDGGPVRPVSLEKVLDVACEQLGVTREQVMGRGRQKMVVLARSLVIHLTRQMTPMSYPEIARAFGRRTHSTVITAEQRVQKQLKQGQRIDLPGELEPVLLADLVDRLRRAVRSG